MPLALFRSEKTPQQLVQNLKSVLTQLVKEHEQGEQANAKKLEKINDDVTKYLLNAKHALMGTPGQEPQLEMIVQLSDEIHKNDIILLLIRCLRYIDFEGKKYTSQILSNLLKRQIGTRYPTVEYILSQKRSENETPSNDILDELIQGYDHQEIALHSGLVLRECTKHDSLASIVLSDPKFFAFFNYVEVSTFDIASDAFVTFKDLLTVHKNTAAQFLEKNYDRFFTDYKKLLTSDNYVTRRQSLKLLGELLLDRHNYLTMDRYIGSAENLKLMMTMLADQSRSIAYEAFHVFKIFVANPNKKKEVLDILLKNKEKLIDFLSKFQSDRKEEEQFHEEREYLIKQVKSLQRPVEPSPAAAASPPEQ
ncbi:hypothetical protein ACHWQZ_G013634 [Mnemiopsis leidyi]